MSNTHTNDGSPHEVRPRDAAGHQGVSNTRTNDGSPHSAHWPDTARTVDPAVLDEVIRRIVEIARPQKIILFGSAARGEMNFHSDIDLLVVKEGGRPLDTMGDIYMNLYGVGAAVDAIVVSPADVERYKDAHALVIKPALREGRVVYDAA